jgi:hypothetical protein
MESNATKTFFWWEVSARVFGTGATLALLASLGFTAQLDQWSRPLALLWLWLGSFPLVFSRFSLRPAWERSASPNSWASTWTAVDRQLAFRLCWLAQNVLVPLIFGVFFFVTQQNISFGVWNGLALNSGTGAYLQAALLYVSFIGFGFHCLALLLGIVKYTLWMTLHLSKTRPRPQIAVAVEATLALTSFVFYGWLVST